MSRFEEQKTKCRDKTDLENEVSYRQQFWSRQVRVHAAVFAMSSNMAATIKKDARERPYTTNNFIINNNNNNNNNTFINIASISLAFLGALIKVLLRRNFHFFFQPFFSKM